MINLPALGILARAQDDRGPKMKYFKPNSLTWWASAAPLFAGMVVAASAALSFLAPFAAVIDAASGGLPAPVLINMGLVGIGLRGAMDK